MQFECEGQNRVFVQFAGVVSGQFVQLVQFVLQSIFVDEQFIGALVDAAIIGAIDREDFSIFLEFLPIQLS